MAHTLKDLEKSLPSIASINGMQVGEHIQALLDEDLIVKEKIGSGNWYWSFVAAEGERKRVVLEKVKEEYKKVQKEIEEAEEEVVEKEEETKGVDEDAQERKEMEAKVDELVGEIKSMKDELARYADNDPVEMQNRVNALAALKNEVQRVTEELQCMESYLLKHMNLDRESAKNHKREWYDQEWNEEEQTLEELPFA